MSERDPDPGDSPPQRSSTAAESMKNSASEESSQVEVLEGAQDSYQDQPLVEEDGGQDVALANNNDTPEGDGGQDVALANNNERKSETQEELADDLNAESEEKQEPAVHASSVESEEKQQVVEASEMHDDDDGQEQIATHVASVEGSVDHTIEAESSQPAPVSRPPFSSIPTKPPPPLVHVNENERAPISALSPPTKPPPPPVRVEKLEGEVSMALPPTKPPPPPIHIDPIAEEIRIERERAGSSSSSSSSGIDYEEKDDDSDTSSHESTFITVDGISDEEAKNFSNQQSPNKQHPFSSLTVTVENSGKRVSTPMSVASVSDNEDKNIDDDELVKQNNTRASTSQKRRSVSEKRQSSSHPRASLPRKSSCTSSSSSSSSSSSDEVATSATAMDNNNDNLDDGGDMDLDRDLVSVKKTGKCGTIMRRVTIAHRLLWIVFACLLAGVVLSTQLNQDTGRTGAVVGLIGWMASMIFLCLIDLRFEYYEPADAAASGMFRNLGFKKTAICCNWTLSLSSLLNEAVVSMMTGMIFAAGFVALYVRYGTYIRDEFWYFLVECALMSVLTAIPLVLLSWNRGGKSKELMMETGLISSKLGGLHILLELCGFYARHFEETERISIVGVDIAKQNDTEIMRIIREQILEPIESSSDGGHTLMLLLICFSTFTGVGVGLALLRRATCRDPKKQRSLEKLLAYAHLGDRMKAMLLVNTFLCMIMIMVLNKGLRTNSEWTHEVKNFSNLASDWILYIMLGFIVWFIALLSLGAVTTRYAGFIKASPWAFTAELGLVCLLTVTPLGYLAFNRGKDHAEMIKDLGVLTLAAGGVHVLLELSGAYTTELQGRYRKDDIQLLPRTVKTEVKPRKVLDAEAKATTRWEDDIPEKEVDETRGGFAAPVRCIFKLLMFVRKATPAHWVLLFVLICLGGGVFLTFGISAAGPKTFVIVGLIGIVAFVILACLCDLRMTYLEPEEARGKCDNVGFKTCRWLCVKEFSLQYFITLAMVSALGGFLVLAGILSIHVRYGGYIRADFWAFLVECALMSVLTAVPVVLVSWNRGGQSKELLVEAGLISGKFGGLHIMLELSGFYAETFEQKMRYSIVGSDWSEKNSTTILKIVHEQILEREKEDLIESVTHESVFMILLLLFFLSSVVVIELAFARRFFCRDKKKARSAEKLHAYHALGARMKAMLVLSVIMLIIVIPIIVLGFRDHDDWEENIKPVSVIWTEIAMGGILLALGASVGLVSFAAATTRYGGFILVAPWSFVAELGMVCLLSVTPLGYVSFNRGHEHEEIELELGILTLKFGGLHLLLELSGFYATALGGRYHRDFITPLPRFNPDAGKLTEPAALVEEIESLPAQHTLKRDPIDDDDYDAGPQEI